MGSPGGVKAGGALIVGNSNGGRSNKGVEVTEASRFWRKLSFFVGCLALQSKREGSTSGNSRKGNSKGQRSKSVSTRSSPNNKSTTGSSTPMILSEELIIASSLLRRFSFNDLRLATRNFRAENFLGEGGFGTVLKGWISQFGNFAARPGMGIPVAVKTLNPNGLQGHREWLAEISYLSELHHPNLVNLIGFCIEDDKRMLVYEFMPRGSLENHLFRRSLSLPWSIRMKIMIGAAKGLAFLHEEAARPVIFRDFKTSNILLDVNFHAKLSDFGLAKYAPVGDASHVSTRVMGTQGYAAPEYVMTGHLTSKSDVYSFGVVLLEMLTGRRAMDKRRPKGEQNLVHWLCPQLREKGRFFYLMDPRLEGRFSMRGAHRAMRLATHCLRPDPKTRPQMGEVVQVLKSLPLHDDIRRPATSAQRMQAGSSSSLASANRYGLVTGPSSNVPRRFRASPMDQNYPLPPPNTSVGLP